MRWKNVYIIIAVCIYLASRGSRRATVVTPLPSSDQHKPNISLKEILLRQDICHQLCAVQSLYAKNMFAVLCTIWKLLILKVWLQWRTRQCTFDGNWNSEREANCWLTNRAVIQTWWHSGLCWNCVTRSDAIIRWPLRSKKNNGFLRTFSFCLSNLLRFSEKLRAGLNSL